MAERLVAARWTLLGTVLIGGVMFGMAHLLDATLGEWLRLVIELRSRGM